jgi:uncharacterized membrane protein YozB (DUF420 family)
MDITIIATGNLVLQIFTLALLTVSVLLKRRGKFLQHARLMLIALVLNAASFFLVMGPSLRDSLLDSLGFFARDPLGEFSIVTAIHAGLGTLAELLGIWVVSSWRLSSSFNKCSSRRKMMRWTLVLWVTALVIGALLYFLKYA